MRRTLFASFVAMTFVMVPLMRAEAARTWHVQGGDVTLAFDDAHLQTLGLEVVGARTTAAPDDDLRRLPGAARSFAVARAFSTPADGISFRTSNGALLGLDGSSRLSLPIRGGLGIGGHDPQTGAAITPIFLYDATVDVDFSPDENLVVLRNADGSPSVIDVRNAGFGFRQDRGELGVYFADLQISESWARALGREYLAGTWIGTMEVHLHATTTDLEPETAVAPDAATHSGTDVSAPLDLLLGELYGLGSAARTGTYPNGFNGLSAATTSCNAGGVNIPWNAPMAETHPFIALALFRLKDGVLEEVGKNWIKHGFFALSSNQCGFGCSASDGSYMGVGCSDTYGFGNNSSQFYLGPRDEVDPNLGVWEACGSYFDGTPQDCNRSQSGPSSGDPHHRLEVWDEDLGNTGASYFYEGQYYVADDNLPFNNIGWRQANITWTGSSWSFSTVGGGLAPNLGPVIQTWGDENHVKDVASDDGSVILAVDVTDLGGGMWHYEYAMYNWHSFRKVHSFSIPVGGATINNVGFHDMDKDAGNDWTVTVAGGSVTWATDDYVTDPNANAIEYQSMYNFRFDANVAPKSDMAQGGIFRPGVGSTFFVTTQVPDGGATDAPVVAAGRSTLELGRIQPSPFRSSASVGFSLPRAGHAKLSVVDVTGRTVRVLLDGEAPAGSREAMWDGRDDTGRQVSSGIYLVRLESADGVRTAKVARIH